MFLTDDFPRHPTFTWNGDLTASVSGWAVCRVREGREASAEFSFFKIEHCVFAEWDVLSEEVVEVV